MMIISRQTHWNHVAYQWRHWGPPLRPCAADTSVMEQMLGEHCERCHLKSPRALLWGVTPEIAMMNWPAGTNLTAIDRSTEMIDVVWPGDVPGQRIALHGEWMNSPAAIGGFDIIVGDGVFTLLQFPGNYRSLIEQAVRLLSRNGILLVRKFVLPIQAESPEAVVNELRQGRIGNFHIFKFRLAMSLQENASVGVRMGDVYDAWIRTGFTPLSLAAATGWTHEAIATIEQYRDRDACLSFPTVHEFQDLLDDRFELVVLQYPAYEMGDRCPIMAYRLRGTIDA